MKDILSGIRDWVNQEKTFSIATVVNTWKSAPRSVGSSLIVSKDMEMIGSVSGGCVEKSVLQKGLKLLEQGQSELAVFGVSNEEAWEVGLSCGGRIEVFIERFLSFNDNETDRRVWLDLDQSLEKNEEVVLVSDLSPDPQPHSLVFANGSVTGEIGEKLAQTALQILKSRTNQPFELEGIKYFAQVFPSRDRMLLIGSAHITSELIALAKMYDFDTIVIDPRDTFAQKTVYDSKPDKLIIKWPQEILEELKPDSNTYAIILSHDPKIDDEALNILLKKEVAYIGALGSRKTHEKRLERLRERGFDDDQLARIHAPVGLDINAVLPREIALSVMAEVIKVKNNER